MTTSGERASDVDVSCIMIFLNGGPFIDEAIRSVLDQRTSANVELVLVDDGSTDHSTEIARQWANREPHRVTYLEHPAHENRGMSASRNLGLENARGRFVAFLDCDDVWLLSMVEQRLGLLRACPGADVALGPTWRWHSWTGAAADLGRDHLFSLPPLPLREVIPPPQLFAAMYEHPGTWRVPAICSMLIRRKALCDVGGFDDAFRGLFEDQVVYTKIGLNMAVVLDDRPLALYRQRDAPAPARRRPAFMVSRHDPLRDTFVDWMRGYVADHGDEQANALVAEIRRHDYEGATRLRRARRKVRRSLQARGIRVGVPDPPAVRAALCRDQPAADIIPAGPEELMNLWTKQFVAAWLPPTCRGVAVVGASGSDLLPSSAEVVPPEQAEWLVVDRRATAGDYVEALSSIALSVNRHGGIIAMISDRGLITSAQLAQRLRGAGLEVIWTEPFGNPATVSVIAGTTAREKFAGVDIDRHDGSSVALWGVLARSDPEAQSRDDVASHG
jgi:glycosyltransferase involved in cell wall biosynthesis